MGAGATTTRSADDVEAADEVFVTGVLAMLLANNRKRTERIVRAATAAAASGASAVDIEAHGMDVAATLVPTPAPPSAPQRDETMANLMAMGFETRRIESAVASTSTVEAALALCLDDAHWDQGAPAPAPRHSALAPAPAPAPASAPASSGFGTVTANCETASEARFVDHLAMCPLAAKEFVALALYEGRTAAVTVDDGACTVVTAFEDGNDVERELYEMHDEMYCDFEAG